MDTNKDWEREITTYQNFFKEGKKQARNDIANQIGLYADHLDKNKDALNKEEIVKCVYDLLNSVRKGF